MKLATNREETITNLSGSRKFTMNASAKAFQILSSGIYERKIEAIVRELSCNAYDSHVMANKVDVPFEIHLPTTFEPYFSVEDFGIGLSEEEVYNVYTTYFESTKTDSNDVIGALGLGSKTPFSYTDSFTVRTRKNGKEWLFNASISSSGEPEVIKMYERPCTEDSGVKVTVEVADNDMRQFHADANKIFSWFKVKPVCNKELYFDIDKEIIENIDKYGYHLKNNENSYAATDCKIVMGNVAYDLDLRDIQRSIIDNNELYGFIDKLYTIKAHLYFRVEIGDADVAASRETLSLDDRTKKNLLDKIDGVRQTFEQDIINRVIKYTNIFKAADELTAYEKAVAENVMIDGLCFNDIKGTRYLQVDPDDVEISKIKDKYDIAFLNHDYNRGWKPRSSREASCSLHNIINNHSGDYKATIVINDCERKMGLKGEIKDASQLPKNVYVVFDKNTTLNSELEKLFDHVFLGKNWKIVYASSFWDGKLSKNKNKSLGLEEKTVKAQILKKDRSNFYYDKIDFNVEDPKRWAYIESFDGDYWITLCGGIVNPQKLNHILHELDLDGVIGCNAQNGRKIKRILSNNIEDLIKNSIDENDLKHLKMRSSFEKALISVDTERLKFSESFEKLSNHIESLSIKNKYCLSLLYSYRILEEHAKSFSNRLKVMEESIKIKTDSSKVLTALFQRCTITDDMIPEIKEIMQIKFKQEI